MIFFSKRSGGRGGSTSWETCASILGLFLAIGIIGGLASLIYGLVQKISSATIGGGVVFGISVFFSIILALIFVFCLKSDNSNSNSNGQRPQKNPNRTQHKQNPHSNQTRQVQREPSYPHELVVVSRTNNLDQQQRPNVYNQPMNSPSNHLSNSTNYAYGKQISSTSLNGSPIVYSNQGNNSNIYQH